MDIFLICHLGIIQQRIHKWDINIENGVKFPLSARQVDKEEKSKLWPICLAYWPAYEVYQKRTQREIPVFICEPRTFQAPFSCTLLIP